MFKQDVEYTDSYVTARGKIVDRRTYTIPTVFTDEPDRFGFPQQYDCIDVPGMIYVGHVPDRAGLFWYHIWHGLLMKYPLKDVIIFAWRNR